MAEAAVKRSPTQLQPTRPDDLAKSLREIERIQRLFEGGGRADLFRSGANRGSADALQEARDIAGEIRRQGFDELLSVQVQCAAGTGPIIVDARLIKLDEIERVARDRIGGFPVSTAFPHESSTALRPGDARGAVDAAVAKVVGAAYVRVTTPSNANFVEHIPYEVEAYLPDEVGARLHITEMRVAENATSQAARRSVSSRPSVIRKTERIPSSSARAPSRRPTTRALLPPGPSASTWSSIEIMGCPSPLRLTRIAST